MSHNDISRLTEASIKWSEQKKSNSPEFFSETASGQSPRYLWIGCVDSRVPVEVICGLEPGEMLTHRNIANQFLNGDGNTNAIIEFAVGALKIPNIVVCGHTACGGIKAGMAQAQLGDSDSSFLSQWVSAIAKLYNANEEQLCSMPDAEAANELAIINVASQVEKLAESAPVVNAWNAGQPVAIHGLLYNLESGTLTDLAVSREGPA